MNETLSKRRVEIEDLYRFRLISDPQASPDGKRVAYVQTRLRKKKNDYASNIWVVPTDGSGLPVKFTGSDARDMSPRWSPDGQELAFISTRSGKPQVWVISTSGGEARRLTRAPRGVGEFEWSPDGRWIAYTSQLDSERDKELKAKAKEDLGDDEEDELQEGDADSRQPGDTSEEGLGATFLPAGEWEEDEDEKSPKEKSDHIRIIERLHYKADGEGFLEREAHLFLIPSKGGKARQITSGDSWSARMPRWSPDGKFLAFVTNMEPDADYHNIQDIFVIEISEAGTATEPARITDHNCAIRGLDWLPSGDGFALFAHKRTDEAAYGTNAEVWNMSMDGVITNLTELMDRNAAAEVNSDLRSGVGALRPHFSKDGSTSIFHGYGQRIGPHFLGARRWWRGQEGHRRRAHGAQLLSQHRQHNLRLYHCHPPQRHLHCQPRREQRARPDRCKWRHPGQPGHRRATDLLDRQGGRCSRAGLATFPTRLRQKQEVPYGPGNTRRPAHGIRRRLLPRVPGAGSAG